MCNTTLTTQNNKKISLFFVFRKWKFLKQRQISILNTNTSLSILDPHLSHTYFLNIKNKILYTFKCQIIFYIFFPWYVIKLLQVQIKRAIKKLTLEN